MARRSCRTTNSRGSLRSLSAFCGVGLEVIANGRHSFPRSGDEFMNFLPNNSLLRERGVAAEGQAHRLEGILSFSLLAARPRCGRPSSRWKSQLSVRVTEKRRRRQVLETIAYVRSLINLSTLPKSARGDERWESALESRSREAAKRAFPSSSVSILVSAKQGNCC